jgi:hypothetical protein
MLTMDMIMNIIDIFMSILGLVLILYVFTSIFYLISTLLSRQKIRKEYFSLLNAILVISGIIAVYLIIFKINEAKVSDYAQACMYFGTKVIYYLPVIFLFVTICFIKNLLGFKKGKEKVNSTIIVAFIVISTVLVLYYRPTRNLINTPIYSLDILKGNSFIADTYDPEKIDKLIEVVNKHIFIRSAAGTQYNFNNRQVYAYIDLTRDLVNGFRRYDLRIYLKDNIVDTLTINYQIYKVQDGEKFTKELFAVFNDLENAPEAMEGFIQMSTDKETYHLPVTGIVLSIKNNGYEKVSTMQSCIIEQFEKDHWERININAYRGEIIFKDYNGAFHVIDRNRKLDFYIPLDNLMDILKPGKYRIVKKIKTMKGEIDVTCEFNLE